VKILRISLCNIASLAGIHTVDFTREPLRSAGLFSISGPTGSGKSTLLDALCLALYDKTPRLSSVKGAVKFDDGQSEITQSNPANLLRRGENNGWSDVVFIGVDGTKYTARWNARRARTGSIQQTAMTLFAGDVQPTQQGVVIEAGKKGEVLTAIEQRVGLSFRQFTRAVLLAQNDFATFLKADDAERAEILQTLTGTERFESISRAVYARNADESRLLNDLSSRLGGSAPLDEAARALANSEVQRTNAEFAKIESELAVWRKHEEWFALQRTLAADLEKAEGALRDARIAYDSAGERRAELERADEVSRLARPLREAEVRLATELGVARTALGNATSNEAKWQALYSVKSAALASVTNEMAAARTAFENAKPHILSARALDARLPDAQSLWAKSVDERVRCEQAKKTALSSRETLSEALKTSLRDRSDIERELDRFQGVAALAAEGALWLERIDHACNARDEVKLLGRQLDAKRAEVKLSKERMDSALRVFNSEQESLGKSAEALANAEKALVGFDPETIASSRNAATAELEALLAIQAHNREANQVAAEIAIVRAELAKLHGESARDDARSEALLQTEIPFAKAAEHAAQRSLELAEAAVSDASIAMREKLEPGRECPVCGSLEHPFSLHQPGLEAAAIRALRMERDRLRKSLSELETEHASLLKMRVSQKGAISDKEKALGRLRERLVQLSNCQLPNAASVRIFGLSGVVLDEELQRGINRERLVLKSAEQAETQMNAARKSVESARKLRDEHTTKSEESRKALEALKDIHGSLSAGLAAVEASFVNAEAREKESLSSLEVIFDSMPEWRALWAVSGADFRRQFESAIAGVSDLKKRQQEVASRVEKQDAAFVIAGESVSRAEDELTIKFNRESECKAALDSLREQRSKLLDGRSVDEFEQEFLTRIRELESRVGVLSGEVAECARERTVSAETLRQATEVVASVEQKFREAEGTLSNWMMAFCERRNCSLERTALDSILLRDEAWFIRERESLSALERGVQTSAGARDVHRQKCESHLGKRPTIEEESSVLAAIEILRNALAKRAQERDSANAVVLADEQRRAACAEIASELERRRISARPWERLNELIGSADGAKFRGIVQRRTLDILLGYANAQLAAIVGRYRLKRIAESLNLVVIDCEMGDEVRSVHSLSGGESFLVSLALALGLAALTSNRLKIESLFIDEGFGSLDGDTLNIAMGALMRLEAQGRKVGVISHVSEMADAIPVQIRVVKGRGGASKLVVPGSDEIPEEAQIASNARTGDSQEASECASKLMEVLRRESAAGNTRVSSRALREEIGCDAKIFNAARALLGVRILVEGRSISLNSVEGPAN
jgi:DNA repair protein SbcC/Rad50